MNVAAATSPLLELIRDQIDLTRVPFSDRGSRLLVYKNSESNHLYLKLAERLICLEPGLEAYLRRPPLVEDLSLIDQDGNELDFKISTSPEKIRFQTRVGDFGLAFQDANTLAFGLPPNTSCGVRFRLRELKDIRRLAYSTNGKLVEEQRGDLRDGSSNVECIVQTNDDCSLTFHVGDKDHLEHQTLPFSKVRADAEARWLSWFNKVPPVAEPYQQKYAYAWWVLANNLVSPLGYVTHEAMMPSKAFYVGHWLWDSALHAIALRHVDAELARDQLRLMLVHQLADGMLPDTVFDEGVVTELAHPFPGKVTKPPILAWAALKLHQTDPDIHFLKEIYDPLVRCNTWWFNSNNDNADGLVQYSHPYSSGLDNSPLWDHGMPVESPDINTYLCIQMDCLADIAEILGKSGEADTWRKRSQQLVQRMVDNLWDENLGLFQALHNEMPIPVLTPFNLYPLWTGRLPREIVERLIQHLKMPDLFWGDYPIATVAKNDAAFDGTAMWRGSVWANVNYFFVEALQKVGERNLLRELRHKTLKLLMNNPDLREYYNPETGTAPASAAPMFAWTAAVFIELALQATADDNTDIQ